MRQGQRAVKIQTDYGRELGGSTKNLSGAGRAVIFSMIAETNKLLEKVHEQAI